MDPAGVERQKQRENLRLALREFGVDEQRFGVDDLDKLLVGGYRNLKFLKDASREGLRVAGLRMARIDQICYAQARVAAALGPGSTGAVDQAATAARATAPQGPPRRVLVDEAARLQPHSRYAPAADGTAAAAAVGDSTTVWEMCYRDGQENRLYLDPTGVVGHVKEWATYRLKLAGDTTLSSGLAPLILSGLVKTGKSYTLQDVVPAAVAEVLQEQRPDCLLSGITVLRLNGANLQPQEGALTMLRNLLCALVEWAVDMNVPVGEFAWQRAQRAIAAPLSSVQTHQFGHAIVDFFKAVKVPVLVLFDELQSFLEPNVNWEAYEPDAAYIRDVVAKQLLVISPRNVLWCVTGSSMGLTWISIAEVPSLWIKMSEVELPATYPHDDMELVRRHLMRQYALDPGPGVRLLQWSETSPGLLTLLVEDWVGMGRPKDIDKFVADFLITKLVSEAQGEWKVSLEGLLDEQRRVVFDLAFAGVGTEVEYFLNRDGHSYFSRPFASQERIENGFFYLMRFLLPYLEHTERGLYYLKDGCQAQILRMALDEDGSLRNNWDDLECSATLSQLDLGWRLLRLGEVADYLFGARAKSRWEDTPRPAGSDGLEGELQALADLVVERLPEGDSVSSRWEQLIWFQEVLSSDYNSGDRSWYSNNKARLETHLDYLVFLLRLSRNVLAHQKPWGGEDPVNLDVVLALPRLLGKHVPDLAQVASRGMSSLARSTVLEAIAALAPSTGGDGGGVSGGGGGGGNGSSGARAVGSSIHSIGCSSKHTTATGSGPVIAGYRAGLRCRQLHISGPWPGRLPGRTAPLAPRLAVQRASFPRAAFLSK